jgi:hypothetical protein
MSDGTAPATLASTSGADTAPVAQDSTGPTHGSDDGAAAAAAAPAAPAADPADPVVAAVAVAAAPHAPETADAAAARAAIIRGHFGLAGDGRLTPGDIAAVRGAYADPARRAELPAGVLGALRYYDANGDGHLDGVELGSVSDHVATAAQRDGGAGAHDPVGRAAARAAAAVCGAARACAAARTIRASSD